MGYYPAIKKKEIMPFIATWMDLEIISSYWSKSNRERQIPYNVTYIWNLKYDTNESIYKSESGKVKMLVAQSFLTLRPHGLYSTRLLCPWDFQARILEWVVIPFSRGSSWPRERTWISRIAGRFFTIWATREELQIRKGVIDIENSYKRGKGLRGGIN